jgi:hypothetical protein
MRVLSSVAPLQTAATDIFPSSLEEIMRVPIASGTSCCGDLLF